jgi:curved DNA-binding protein CbpA
MLGRQRELHPDKFASRGDRVVQMARELSGRVNKAYDVLGNPLKRAEYIVSRVRHRQSNYDKRGQSEAPSLWGSVGHHV